MSKPPLYVAELSANHNQSLDRANKIIDALADAGASAIKLQTYTPDTMTLPIQRQEFMVSKTNDLWGGRHLYDLYSEAMTPWEWHRDLFSHTRDRGMVPFSSPFDRSAVDFLEDLDCPIYKIASFEIVDVELIAYAASTGKPLIMSTGMASLREISVAVETAEKAGCTELTLLKTTSAYPAHPRDSNLSTMQTLKDVFGWPVGLSDHTSGIGVAIAAVAMGASVIEKHVTLSRADGGVDSAFSLEPGEFSQMVQESSRALEAIGQVTFGPTGDAESLQFRRSYILTRDVKAGERLSLDNARALRPGGGLAVADFPLLQGMVFTTDCYAGDPLEPGMFK